MLPGFLAVLAGLVTSVGFPAPVQAEQAPRPVRGAATPSGDVPTLGVGRYTDTLPATGVRRVYRVHRTLDDSTVWMNVTSTLPPGATSSLDVSLSTIGGDDCDSQSAYPDTGASSGLASLSVTSVASAGIFPACRSARELTVVVEVSGVRSAGQPLHLTVVEEPPGEAPQARAPGDTPRWRPLSLQGAASRQPGSATPAAAPITDASLHRTVLTPGSIRYYKAPLEWGQWLVAAARAERAPAGLDGDHTLAVSVLSPVGGRVGQDFDLDAGAPTGYATLGDSVTDVATGTVAVSPAWRQDYDLQNRGASLPGYYVVALSLSGQGGGGRVPVVFRMQRFGEPGQGAPAYARAFPASTAGGPTGVGSNLPATPPSPPAAQGFWSRFGWYRRGAALTLVVAGGALLARGVTLGRRRRTAH